MFIVHCIHSLNVGYRCLYHQSVTHDLVGEGVEPSAKDS